MTVTKDHAQMIAAAKVWGIDSNVGPFTPNDGIVHFGLWCEGVTGTGTMCLRNHTERHPWPTCWAAGTSRAREARTSVSVVRDGVNCPDCIEWIHA